MARKGEGVENHQRGYYWAGKPYEYLNELMNTCFSPLFLFSKYSLLACVPDVGIWRATLIGVDSFRYMLGLICKMRRDQCVTNV